jgi:hypothetical protein
MPRRVGYLILGKERADGLVAKPRLLPRPDLDSVATMKPANGVLMRLRDVSVW